MERAGHTPRASAPEGLSSCTRGEADAEAARVERPAGLLSLPFQMPRMRAVGRRRTGSAGVMALAAKAARLGAAIRCNTGYKEAMAVTRKSNALAQATMAKQRAGTAPSSAIVQKLPGPDVTMEDALRVLRSEGEVELRRSQARAIIEKLFVHKYLSEGVSASELASLQDEISMWTDHTLSQMEQHIESPSGFNNQTDEQYLVSFLNNYPGVAFSFNDHFKRRLAEHSFLDVLYKGLAKSSGKQLARRLMDEGWSSDEARRVADAIASDFSRSKKRPVLDGAGAAIEFALSAIRVMSEARPAAVDLWVDRDPQEFPTAESFLRRHYGHRLGIEGDLTLREVGRIDTPLLTALNREFKGRRHELHLLLPTVKERADQKLLKKYGYVPTGTDRKSKLTMMSLERKPAP